MPRHTQPIELARLKGADTKNPQRYRKDVPKSRLPLGEPPDDMTDGEQSCWFELSALSLPGVLTGADRIGLEMLAALLREYRDDRRGFAGVKHNAMVSLLGRFGMTPSDRTKLGVENNKDENPFARLDD